MGSRRSWEANERKRASSVRAGSRETDRTSARSGALPTAEPARRRPPEFYARQLQPEIRRYGRSDGWADRDAESHQGSRAARLDSRYHSLRARHPAGETRDRRPERRRVGDDVPADTN